MATYREGFSGFGPNADLIFGPNWDVDKPTHGFKGGPGSKAFYIEVNGQDVTLTYDEMRTLFQSFLNVHDYYAEHGVTFEEKE